jgi:hypothetical protein
VETGRWEWPETSTEASQQVVGAPSPSPGVRESVICYMLSTIVVTVLSTFMLTVCVSAGQFVSDTKCNGHGRVTPVPDCPV